MNRAKALAAVCAIMLAALGSCATLEELAPPVDEHLLRVGGIDPFASSQVQRGRELYITDCARCHSPEPVIRYSAQQWREILPRMAKETSLGDEDRAAIEAYVMAVLRAKDQ